LGADNVLLEGPTDQYLLAELIRAFATPENVGEFVDLNALVMVSADGAGNVRNVLEQSVWADEPVPPTVVLLDSDKAAEEAIAQITGQKGGKSLIAREFVTTVGALVTQVEARDIVSIEDIVPSAIYSEAIVCYVKKWLPETCAKYYDIIKVNLASAEFGKKGLAMSTAELFAQLKPELGGQYDKLGIAQEVLEEVNRLKMSDPENEKLKQLVRNVVAICDFVREGLEKSRSVVAKQSTTQSTKRIIHQFKLLNRDNVPITALQSLFKRIGREALPIGTDGESLTKVVIRYLSELEKLRSAGQERITGDTWHRWLGRIEAMRKNPLSARLGIEPLESLNVDSERDAEEVEVPGESIVPQPASSSTKRKASEGRAN
jgi:hypothetical protein